MSYVVVVYRNFSCDRHTLRIHCQSAYIPAVQTAVVLLRVVRVVVHGIFIRPSQLAIWFYTTHLANFSIRSRRQMECRTPVTMLQYASRTGEVAEVSISTEAFHATIHAFDAEKYSISYSNIYFFPVSYSLTSELWHSGPAEAAHVNGGAPFAP